MSNSSDGDAEGALQDAVDVGPERAAVLEDEVAHAVGPPLRAHEVEDGVAEPVREEAVDRALGDLGDLVVQDGVAQDHDVLFVLVVAEVGGHALRQPLRRAGGVGADEVAAEEDLELEDVRQLVGDQLLELLVGQVDGQHHPVARGQGERADAFRDEFVQRVGLLELGVRRVIDDVDRLGDLEVERPGDVVVGALGVGRDLLERDLVAVVEVDGEVRRVVDLPVERVVDDLVLAEVVVVRREHRRLGGDRGRGGDGQGEGEQKFLHAVVGRQSLKM